MSKLTKIKELIVHKVKSGHNGYCDQSLWIIITIIKGGEEGQPQQFLVRATFSSFSRPSHLEILVL